MTDLNGKVALVTGASGGIGAAVARSLHEGGASVGLLSRRGEDLGLERALGIECDVGDRAAVERATAQVVERFGRLDIAVANAGAGVASPIADHTLADWQQVLDVTLTGAFLTVQAASRVMADGGSIVAIASLNAVQPARRMAAYCAAKAGVVALVDVAALEFGPRGIRVNAIAPGLIRTPATEALWGLPGMVEAYRDNTALGRHGMPDDIAAAVAYLASDDAAFVTGTTLLVDGGAHHLSYPDTGKVRARAAEERS
jgi:3-oxoacyl-[acyl-carrier protein] reductase